MQTLAFFANPFYKIQKLIPFLPENFVTFQLAITKIIYIPFYNYWQILSTSVDLETFVKKAKDILKGSGYTIDFQYNKDVQIYNYTEIQRNRTIVYFQIYPIYEIDTDNDGNVFVNVDPLSFDVDAIDLLIKIISK